MFAMLVGTPPFETKSLGRTYAKIAANEYEIPERLSPSAKTFIAMLLNPEPKNRGHLHHSGRASPDMSVLTKPNWTGSDRIRLDWLWPGPDVSIYSREKKTGIVQIF